MKNWKSLKKDSLVNTSWLQVDKEQCLLPNGKIINDFYTLWQPDWVLILARTVQKEWVLTKQYRHGSKRIEIEFPAGIIEKNESIEQAAIRELKEECGYTFCANAKDSNPIYVGTFFVNPDRHRGKFHVVFLDNVNLSTKTHFDENEDIESFCISDEELQQSIKNNLFSHPLQIAGYYKWKLLQI